MTKKDLFSLFLSLSVLAILLLMVPEIGIIKVKIGLIINTILMILIMVIQITPILKLRTRRKKELKKLFS